MATLQGAAQFSDAQRMRVEAHLQELLDCPAFAGSRRRRAFLRYVVQETLGGRGHAIKETNIAVDVFERDSDFDTQSASVVRVTAGEVRKRLAQAYAAGLDGGIRIELPLGSYQPNVVFLTEPVLTPVAPPPATGIFGNRLGYRRVAWILTGLAVVAALVFASGVLAPKPPLDNIWRPFLAKGKSVLISLAAPTVLVVADAGKWLPLRPGESIPTEALQEMQSAYVGTGGAMGAALFAEQLASRGQPFVLKFSGDLSFADLKNAPAILVGASRWTRELTQDLRFRLISEGDRLVITDSQRADRSWSLPKHHRKERVEGYSVITRLMRSESGQPTLLVVGMDARDTQAGVEFLARGEKFGEFAVAAPKGWESKNFQIVLRSTMHGNSSGSFSVVASQIW